MTDDIDSPGVEAGVGVEAGRGVGGAAGLRAVNLALISSNGVWLEDDERTADVAAPGGGVEAGITKEENQGKSQGI
ncbi:hypothetical protein RAB80_018167 [Fusarium oxysporum f. sp. vasinfectum]|nr:hypothetical protein RAB80_018167 [Fusarium oxysporum f. sp. vasinfectum]